MITLSWKKYLIFVEEAMDESTFLRRVGVSPEKYAGDLFKRIYSYLTTSAYNLEHVYNKYYAEEYCTFELFLHKKERFNEELIQVTVNKIAGGCSANIFQPKVFGDFAIPQLLEAEDFQWIFDVLCGGKSEN